MSDTFDLLPHYKHVRVVDVVDALDGIGYFDIGLMDPSVRPLWNGMKFWGAAYTQRCVPSNRPMWKLDTTEDIVNAHGIWFREVGNVSTSDLKPGHVVVTATGGAGEVGFWGSANALNVLAAGGVGIITDGYARDTGELTLQKTPICCRSRGRTIIPGRIMSIETQTTVGCGGAQVNPGDIVGADDDGVVVVPAEVAEEVATHAKAILLADMKARRSLYAKLDMEPDETVDVEGVEEYYRGLS
jgi:4-hydroxy-4-methyl-2-oxoglutarate aldolase